MNIGTVLTRSAARWPERAAIRYGDQLVSYREFNDAASRFGSALRQRGLSAGDRIAFFMPNNPAFIVAMFGALKAGFVIVPVNAKLGASELAYILSHSDASALLFAGSTSEVVDAALVEVGVQTLVYVGDSGRGDGLEDLLAEGSPTAADLDRDQGDPAWLFYTSGTTGRPKGAQLSHRNLTAMMIGAIAEMCDFRADDVVLHAAPLSHGSGLYLFPAIARGSEQLIYDRKSFDPDYALELVARRRVTVMAFLAPTMIAMLLDAAPSDTTSLRRVVYGGAPTLTDQARRMLQRFGSVFVQLYWMGESPMTICSLSPEEHDPGNSRSLASAGFARLGVEVSVTDADGRPKSVDEEGEIRVRGDVVMTGYWRDPEATANALQDGWLRTGDIGQLDESGRLTVLDRRSDLIITGGTNVYPREVEDALILHPAVVDVVAYGLPDEKWGQAVAATVVLAAQAEASEEDLIGFCRTRIASFKKPTRILVSDEIPKNAYGKILRREARSQAIERLGI